MRALITGARGQDGTLLRERLVERGFEVLGVDRAVARNDARDEGIRALDIRDESALRKIVEEFGPNQIYHLAACHHSSEERSGVHLDREMVETNFRSAAVLTTLVAERFPSCRILLAGSSQMYRPIAGRTIVIDEGTIMNPSSFYGWTKAWSRELMAQYRDRRGVFGTTVILFNHESRLRAPHFVTRKISMAAARASIGEAPKLHLMDIYGQADWSSATDIVEAMYLALAAAQPADYVLASGEARRVVDVLEAAFGAVGLDWRDHTTFDHAADRADGALVGDATRARTSLGWLPRTSFDDMIAEMVHSDVKLRTETGQRK